MAQSLMLASGAGRSSAHPVFARRPEERVRCESPDSEQDFARFSNVNLFVVGADDLVAKVVTSLWPSLATPVVLRHRGEPLWLPPTLAPAGTIVVHDVNTLTPQEQDALNHWIGAANRRTRIVSTASQSLLPLVDAGVFNDSLYYRLNVVMIDLNDVRPS